MLFESRRGKKLLVRKRKSVGQSGKAPNASIVLRPEISAEISRSDIILDPGIVDSLDPLDPPTSRILDPGATFYMISDREI